MNVQTDTAVPASGVQCEAKSREPAAPAEKRVGTFTMGLAMIVCGIGLIIWMCGGMDDHTFLSLCRFSPLLMVGVGVEMCVFGAAGDRVHLKYDFISLIFCGILMCLTLGLSTLAVLAVHQ